MHLESGQKDNSYAHRPLQWYVVDKTSGLFGLKVGIGLGAQALEANPLRSASMGPTWLALEDPGSQENASTRFRFAFTSHP